MSLITIADVIARYPRTIDVGSATLEGSWIPAAIAEVEGTLAAAYTIPFSSNNITAVDLSIDMTYCRMQESKQSDISEGLRARLDKRMEDLLAGTTSMVTSDSNGVVSLASAGGIPWSNTMDYHPVFGMGDIENSVVDSSEIYDEEQAKL